jgi:hypothetical protein
MLPIGAIDGNMLGQPSGPPVPGVGATAFVGFYGAAPATTLVSALIIYVSYDDTYLLCDPTYAVQGIATCSGPLMPEPWTLVGAGFKIDGHTYLVNGFRVASDPASRGSTLVMTISFTGVASGDTVLVGTQDEWADETATTIPGPAPLPWVNPGMCSGVRVP